MEFLKLHRGRREAAESIWAALQHRDESRLLTRAVVEALQHPAATAAEAADAADAAEAFHEASNAARAESLRSEGGEATTPVNDTGDQASEIRSETATAFRSATDHLLDALRSGAKLNRYDQGSIQLLVAELAGYINPGAETEAA